MFVTEISFRSFHGCRAYQARHPLLELMHSNLPILRLTTEPAPARGPLASLHRSISLAASTPSRGLKALVSVCASPHRLISPAGRRDDIVIRRPLIMNRLTSHLKPLRIRAGQTARTANVIMHMHSPELHDSLWVCRLVDFSWYFQLVQQLRH